MKKETSGLYGFVTTVSAVIIAFSIAVLIARIM